MRSVRAVVLALFVGGALFAALPASGEPSDACGGDPVAVSDSSVSVCITGTGVLDGNATAALAGNGGYIIADGDSTNPGCLHGYIGIQVVDDEPQPVASAEGDYGYPADPAGEPDPAQTVEDCSP